MSVTPRALERFDPNRGYPFVAFAVPTIVGDLKKHFRDRRLRVRVPRELQERYLEVRAARDRLVQALGRTPTMADVAAELHITCDEVAEAMEAESTFSMPSITLSSLAGGDRVAPTPATPRP